MPWVTKHGGEEYPPKTPPPLLERDKAFTCWQHCKRLALTAGAAKGKEMAP